MATQAKIDIKSAGGTTLLSTSINEGAKGYYSLMQHDYIVLPFKLRTPIDFKIGSYVDLRGVFDDALGGKLAKMYYVTELQNPSYNTSTGAYEYQLRLNAYYWLWNNFIFKYTPESTAGEASWSLTAPLDVQLGVFLRNLSELGFTYNGVPYEYSIDSTVENKAVAMTYDNTRLLDALFSMGGENAWDCDVWVTENVIHFGRCEHGDAVKIEIGVEASDMTRNESRGTFATRIYAFGSTRNIPENYRETSNPDLTVNGIVQKRLMLPADTPYIDAYPDMQPFEVVECVMVNEAIYPKRIGTLSDVKTVDRAIEDGEGNQTGTFKAYQYKDAGLTFSDEYKLEGKELRIVFQSGKLNGLDFGVIFNPDDSNPAEQLWEIEANEDYGRRLPDEVMKPENGDKYILYGFNIKLVSDQYTPEAEQELKEWAQGQANRMKIDDGTYTVPLRASYVREDMISRTYDVGQKVNLVNPSFFGTEGRISRVIGWEMCLDIPSDNPVYTIGESAQYSRLTEIEDKVDSLVFNGQTYQGTGGGSGVYVIRTNDSTPASDSNVFSALRSLATFLRKDKEDSTNYLLRMLGGAHFFPFVQGMIGGSGAAFYKNAAGKTYMEADGAYLRDELVVPQITFNCIDVISGDKANTFAFGTIKSVDTENKTAELDLLEDQTGTLHVDDICRGVFHNLDGNNRQDDMEDSNGFYGYAGFSTSYFTPTEIVTNEPGRMVFRYSLQAGTSIHPMKGMNFFAYGNFTDKTRQSITYETRYYTRRLKDVNTWVIDPTKNISMQDGLLEGLTIGGMVMHGYGTFQENCYFTGVNIQFTPDIENALKGQDAYSVSLSSYERVVKMDENGNIVSLLEALNVVTGDENVITGDKNVITTQKRIQTHIQAFKGSTELLYSDTMDAGVYKVTLSPQGCTASVEGGIVSIDSITATENCFVDIQVNCEGNAVFDKRFSVSIIRDGSDAYIVDLDNEMSSVACNAEGDIVAGLPVTSGVAFYKGTKALAISKMVTEAPAGVTCSVDEETHSVTVSAIGKEVAESFGITVTVTADDEGVPVTRSTVMTILKVKAGENATLYRLAPSVNIVKIDKEGNYSETYLSCGVNKVNGKGVSSLSTLPKGIEMTVKKDGLSESGYSLNDDIPTEGISKSVTFRLKQEGVLIDTETIPFVADGMDGFTNIIADLDNEMASVACDADGNVKSGLPIVSTIHLYYGTREMELDSLEVEEPAGVTAKADKSTGKVTISSIASYTPDAVSVPVTCSGSFGGQSYGRTAYIKINKVKPGTNGENAVIYSLVVEPSAIKVDKSGTLSSSSVSCKVKKTDGNSSSVVSSLPSGYTLRGYVDGDYTQTYSNASATVTVSKEWQSVGFRLMDGTTVIDEETIPIVKDGADGFGSVILDLDNEMASVACDADGNVKSGLPVVINFDMFFGTEEMDITSISNPNVSGVSVSNNVSAKTSTITSIGSGTPESIEIEYTVKGTYSGTSYERKAVFRILKVTTGENGKDAVIYQLSPSVNVVKVNKNGSYIDSTIKCTLTKNDGGDVSSVSSLPPGFRMTIQRDSGSENTYTIGNNVSTTSASDKIAFRLYYGNVLADIETVPVVKDGTDGKDGQDGVPGEPGQDGEQGIQGCVTRVSIWTLGREYRNDSEIESNTTIRYIDVAMLMDTSVSTGWRAFRCKITHTSSSSIRLTNTTYWEEFTENVTAIYTDLIISKNAVIQFMQGNQILIMSDDGPLTAGISGSMEGDKIRFWAGSGNPSTAPFRVDYLGHVWATDGTFAGDLSARTMTFKRSTSGTSEAINGALVTTYDELGRFPEVSGDDVKVIEILHPLMSRTLYSVTFMGVNSNVYFAPDNDVLNAVSSLSISNIQGCYFRCFGYNNNGKTYWSVVPMNDNARIELENA